MPEYQSPIDLYAPGDRVMVEGRPGTYYSRSRDGEFHIVELDEPIEQGGPLSRGLSAFRFFSDGPAMTSTIVPVVE